MCKNDLEMHCRTKKGCMVFCVDILETKDVKMLILFEHLKRMLRERWPLEMDNTQMEGKKECLGIPAGKMLKTP